MLEIPVRALECWSYGPYRNERFQLIFPQGFWDDMSIILLIQARYQSCSVGVHLWVHLHRHWVSGSPRSETVDGYLVSCRHSSSILKSNFTWGIHRQVLVLAMSWPVLFSTKIMLYQTVPREEALDRALVLRFRYPLTLIWPSTLPEKLARRKYSLCVNKAMLRPCGLG